MNQISLLMVIVRRDWEEGFVSLLRENQVQPVFSLPAQGTATPSLLNLLGQGHGESFLPIKHLDAPMAWVRGRVLMDADEGGVFDAIDQRHPVVKVGDLLFPQGTGALIVDGYVGVPGHYRWYAIEPHELVQLQGDGQIDLAFRLPGGRNRAAILSPVAGVNDEGLLVHPGKGRQGLLEPGRLGERGDQANDGEETQERPALCYKSFQKASLPWNSMPGWGGTDLPLKGGFVKIIADGLSFRNPTEISGSFFPRGA